MIGIAFKKIWVRSRDFITAHAGHVGKLLTVNTDMLRKSCDMTHNHVNKTFVMILQLA